MLKLFYAADTCALATHIVLEEIGVPYETVRIDFSKDEQKKPEYLAVNPKARVPSLVTERGILTETPALLLYLAQQYPQANLAPLEDAFALAELQAFNCFICSTLHVAHAHRMRGHRWVDDPAAILAMQRKVPVSVGSAWDLVEQRMFKGPWVMGDSYTVGDPYVFTLAQWMEADGVDPARFPKVADHRSRMRARPAVTRALHQEGSA